MPTDSIKLDADGIPVLENPVSLETLQATTAAPTPPLPDLTDHDVMARLLQNSEVQSLLDDMSDDLQKLVSWKIESLIKDQISRLIKEAAEESAPKMAEDIHTQLQLALPGLLASMVEQAKTLKPDD